MNACEILDRYERRIRRAAADMPVWKPWDESDRGELLDLVRQSLGIAESWTPQIETEKVRTTVHPGFCVEHLRFTSWPDVVGAAHLYIPDDATPGRTPFVLLCCGHGEYGKHSSGYQAMARHIARMGAAVLVPDNIGQGERVAMQHREAYVPFACGTSLQGLIVAETLGWVRWIMAHSLADTARIAAIGNSGGGNLTLFLGPLAPELTAVSSSGHPSTFEWIALKEKTLCPCALVPGALGRFEMWHVYSLVAPRPLFLFQGWRDEYFPEDTFHPVRRKAADVYRRLGREVDFRAEVTAGAHSWDRGRRGLLGGWLAEVLALPRPLAADTAPADGMFAPTSGVLDAWPAGAIDTAELSRRLTGTNATAEALEQVYPMPEDGDAGEQLGRVSLGRLVAQYRCFLGSRADD